MGSFISVVFGNYVEKKREEAFLRPFDGLRSETTSRKIQKQASGNKPALGKCKTADQGHNEEYI